MRAVKPIQPIDKEMPMDPELLQRLSIAAAQIRRGETQPLEEVIAELQEFIQEKYPVENIYNNNKQNSQERPF